MINVFHTHISIGGLKWLYHNFCKDCKGDGDDDDDGKGGDDSGDDIYVVANVQIQLMYTLAS